MKTMKWTLLLAFFAIWACQEEQFSQEEVWKDSSSPSPRVERLRTIKRVDNAPATRAVSVKDKLWQPGDTIRIKFQNADEYPGMSDKVIQYAAIWLQYAYLHFEYVDKAEEADVKIGFNMDTRELAWSTIGTDCKQVSQDEVSLNFYGLEYEDESGIKSEILKGFGHILGLGFEHKNPNDDQLVFINDEVKDYYNLSDQDVIELTQLYNTDQTNYTDYDPESIMTLEIPKKILTKPTQKYRTNRNNELSNLDTIHIAELYPFSIEPVDSCIISIDIMANSIDFGIWLKKDIELDWGNGKRELFTVTNSNNGCYWIYSPTLGTNYIHHIKIYGADTAITGFALSNDQLLAVDISKNKDLEELSLNSMSLSSFDITKNINLKELYCARSAFNSIDLRNNINLEILDCSKTYISNLDLTQNKKLTHIDISNNALSNINLHNITNLNTFYGNNNNFSYLNFKFNTNLLALNVSYNDLDTIDIHYNHKLLNLNISNNKISHIDISQNTELQFLNIERDSITTIDISGHNLIEFYADMTLIDYPTLKGIFNTIIDRTSDYNGRIRFPSYCYRNSMALCGDREHENCNKDEINLELATLFKTKNWILVDSRGWEIYKNAFYQQVNLKGPDYFQQLFKSKFGNNRLL